MRGIEVPSGLARLAGMLPRPIYLVGGYVRNALLGTCNTDMDIAGEMLPDQITGCLPRSQFVFGTVNRRLGTVLIRDGESGEEYEYTTFRTETYPAGGAHVPCGVAFTGRLEQDAQRRDFTANAVYYDIPARRLIDPLGGVRDIERRTLRAARPERVFSSDGLRILRLARQAAELGFAAEKETFEAAKRLCGQLADISPERIREELERILQADGKYPALTRGGAPHFDGLLLLYELGAFSYVIPELLEGDGMAQRPDFHRYPVLRHALETVRHAHASVRLAALLHDVAKPRCFRERGKFAGHDEEGAAMARDILRRLRYPNRVTAEVSRLIALHMYDLDGLAKEAKVRVKLAQNWDIAEKLLLLKQADYLGSGLQSGESPVVAKWRGILERMRADGTPLSVRELAVGAEEIAQRFCLSGRELGRALDTLWRAAVKDPALNERDKLLAYAKSNRLKKE